MKCDCACRTGQGGKNEAYCDCQWASDAMPTQTATLCKECAEELWEMLNPLLQLNKAWYRIDAPGVIKHEANNRLGTDSSSAPPE